MSLNSSLVFKVEMKNHYPHSPDLDYKKRERVTDIKQHRKPIYLNMILNYVSVTVIIWTEILWVSMLSPLAMSKVMVASC